MVTIFSSNSNRFTLTNILFPANQEPPSAITVTIGMEWNTDVVKKSIPALYTTKVASNTNLKEIINKAADKNTKGPFNKYSTTYYGGQGHFITAMNGTKEVCDQWPLTPVLRNLDLRISLFFASRCFFIYEANSEPKLIAANAAWNKKGPFNKYTPAYYGGQGHFITSMNGLKSFCFHVCSLPQAANLWRRMRKPGKW